MSGVEAVAWMTPEGFEAVKKGPRNGLNGHRAAWARADNVATVPLYSQATVDNMRAQLEAAEARHEATERDACQQAERANDYRDRLLAALERAVSAEARAEAAEADCARLKASIGAIHYHAGRKGQHAIQIECEEAVPALAEIARTKEQQA